MMLEKKRSISSRIWSKCKAALHLNRFEKTLRSLRDPKVIYIAWNRGMGDVPLGLYGAILRIRHFFPHVEIVFLTREDLLDIFALLPDCRAQVVPGMKRGKKCVIDGFTPLISSLDPTKDLPWLPGMVAPELILPKETLRFDLKGKKYVGIHIDTETGGYYGYEKNWAKEKWDSLIEKVLNAGKEVILFGREKKGSYPGVVDLRGETTLSEVCLVALNHCACLIAPDSGILSTVYYVKSDKPIRIVSLWNDPNQGVLRQRVPSPNPNLEHIPLIGLATITPDDVYSHLNFEKGSETCE